MILKRKLLLLSWIVFLFFSGIACTGKLPDQSDSLGTLPLPMREHIEKVNCAAIRDFYSNYIVLEPPFVWFNNLRGFALVCERQDAGSLPEYVLIIRVDKGKHPFASCPANINLLMKPGGLYFEERKISAGIFVKLENREPLEFIPDIKHPVLTVSTDTGGFIEYICIGGEWFFNTYS